MNNAGLTQQEALNLIIGEREYQDKTFPPDEIRPSGLTRAQEHTTAPVHLTMIQSYLDDAKACWTRNKPTTNVFDENRTPGDQAVGSVAACQDIAKIAAMCLRALERIPQAKQLLEAGLR